MEKFQKKKPSLKCDDCKNGVVSEPVKEATEQPLEEFVVGAKGTSMEKDDKQPVNVVSKEPTTADRSSDKSESPRQSMQVDDDNDVSGGSDEEKKILVPSKIKTQLRDEIKKAEADAKKLDYSDRQAAQFYMDLAQMFTDLLTHIEGGTSYDIKKAQIFMTSLMGPMLHKIPADVVNFLARGGEPASLKSYMNAVNVKV